MRPKRLTYNIKRDAVFKNKVNNETHRGDLIDEDYIDGKPFFVVRKDGKVFKLSKESFSIVKHA